MSHCDPEDLTLLALGEDVDVDLEHLASCARCRAELEATRSVVAAARSGQVEEVLPPPRVWEGIAAAAGVSAAPRTTSAPAPGPRPLPMATGARRWPTVALAAAAVAGFLLGGAAAAGVAAVTGEDPADPRQGGEPVVAADLEPLVATAGQGSAQVLEAPEGPVLRLTARQLPADQDGFYEVWLLDEQAQRMIPLGVLGGADGEFVVPEGLDLGEFPVVDVSVEPYDGDPAHSGNSLLRGTLGT